MKDICFMHNRCPCHFVYMNNPYLYFKIIQSFTLLGNHSTIISHRIIAIAIVSYMTQQVPESDTRKPGRGYDSTLSLN